MLLPTQNIGEGSFSQSRDSTKVQMKKCPVGRLAGRSGRKLKQECCPHVRYLFQIYFHRYFFIYQSETNIITTNISLASLVSIWSIARCSFLAELFSTYRRHPCEDLDDLEQLEKSFLTQLIYNYRMNPQRWST